MKKNKQKFTGKNAEKKQRIIEFLERGATLVMAANAVKICRTTLWNWRKEDEAFDEAVCDVWIEQSLEDLDKLSNSDDWRAAAWKLERREKSMQLKYEEPEQKQSNPLEGIDLDKLEDDELATLIRLIRKSKPDGDPGEG